MAIIKYKNPQNNEFETVEIAGGSSVIANPDEAAAADLNKIQIDDVIYNVVGSGGGGTGKVEMQRTLINRTTAKSSTPVNNFSDDNGNLYKISDFDLLYFQLYRETTGYPPWYPDSGFCFIEDFIDSQYGLSYNNGTSRSAIAIYSSDTAILYNDTFTGIDAVEVYGIKLVGSGSGGNANIVSKSVSEYNALTTAEKTNGNAYFVKEEDAQEALDMSSTINYIESATNMIVTTSKNETIIKWNGSTGIGCNFNYSKPIDVTNSNKITFELVTRTCYDGTASRDSWDFRIALMKIPPTTRCEYSSTMDVAITKTYKNANTDYGTQELDVSELEGEYYVVVWAIGWNATLSNIKYDGIEKRCIYYKDEVYSGNCNVTINKGNGLDYSTTEQDLGVKWIDGRKIYRKCFSDLTTGSTPHNIENFGQPIKIEIIGKTHDGDFVSLNYHNSRYSAGVYAVIDSTNIKINQASMSETFTFDVILEYVKTAHYERYDMSTVTATSWSESSSSTYSIEKMLDNNTATCYGAATASQSGWVKFEMPTPIAAAAYSMTSRTVDANDANVMPKTWTLSGSNDNSTWTVIDTRENIAWSGSAQEQTFKMNNSTKYKYYKLDFTELYSSANYMQFSMAIFNLYTFENE